MTKRYDTHSLTVSPQLWDAAMKLGLKPSRILRAALLTEVQLTTLELLARRRELREYREHPDRELLRGVLADLKPDEEWMARPHNLPAFFPVYWRRRVDAELVPIENVLQSLDLLKEDE